MIRGRLLHGADPDAATEVLDEAAAEYEALGAPALAASAREPVAG
jgi:hypothetical protein